MGSSYVFNCLKYTKPSTILHTLSVDQNKDIISTQLDTYLFTVYCEPQPLLRHRSANGIIYNPSAKFQKEFLYEAECFLPSNPLEGPLAMDIKFYFSRPQSHYRSGKFKNLLKESAPIYHHTRKDLDNLIKFVLDSLNKKAFKDDSQVALITSGKFYTSKKPRVEVKISQLSHKLPPEYYDIECYQDIE